MVNNRQRRIDLLLNKVKVEQQTSIEDLSNFFNVSTATIRRDIKELEKRGVDEVGGQHGLRDPNPILRRQQLQILPCSLTGILRASVHRSGVPPHGLGQVLRNTDAARACAYCT